MIVIPPATLSALGARLSATPRSNDALDAVVDGMPVEVRFVLRSSGSSSSKWTEIGVKSEHIQGFAFTFNFDVREATRGDAADVREGRLRDLVVGDGAFDEAFVVEAAPADVARLMFDETARAEMLALRPLRVISTKVYAVMIERLDWIEDVDLLERLVKLTVRIAATETARSRTTRSAPSGTPTSQR